jgi:hypothetical protein
VGVPGACPDARTNRPAAARPLHRGRRQSDEDEEEDDEEDDEDEELEGVGAAAGVLLGDVDDVEEDESEEDEPAAAGVGDELARLSVR